MDENSVESSQTGNGSIQMFGNLFGEKPKEQVNEELDENGEVIRAREEISKEQKLLAEKIAKKKIKKWYHVNPINKVRERITRASVRERRLMLLREETMKQDLERFLMELEERNCWLAYELNGRNYKRLVNEETIRVSRNREMSNIAQQETENQLETGLKFFRGNIRGYRRWQCSAAKHLDLKGHSAAVFSCKLSKCLKYILSCSGDKTVKLWSASSGSLLKTFYGHTRKVMDGDFHPNFVAEVRVPGIITCGGDGSVRVWNAISDKPMMVVKVHPEAVYKTSFSPDGQRVVTCSEDCTVKTWAFPEMYLLYTYRYHTSPVSTVRFSPTGKYLVSGSDFGERKLVVWDAMLPHVDQAQQFPHMIFWTETGLISKILIKPALPSEQFWLNQNQLSNLDQNGIEIEQWYGQDDNDDPVISDSESEDEEAKAKRIERENFGLDDVKEVEGVLLVVDKVDCDGVLVSRRAADEYQPGGNLLVALETFVKPIAEAFGTVTIRDARYDCNSVKSGGRLGTFVPTLPTPGEPALQDALGLRPPFRVVPDGITTSAKDQAIIYKSAKQQGRERDAEELRLKKIADAKKLAISIETDPEKKRANLLLKKQREQEEEEMRNRPPLKKKAATPALGKNIVVLREAIKAAPRKKHAVVFVSSADEPLHTIAEGHQDVGDPPMADEDDAGSLKLGEEKEPLDLRGMECIWVCPEESGMGAAVITVNVRLEGETQWHKMTYSIRESPIKIRSIGKKKGIDGVGLAIPEDLGNVGPNGEKYMFDQVGKHNELWTHIKQEDWGLVESMMTKNVLAFYDKKIVARTGKVTELLQSIFGNVCDSLIVPTPFLYRPGMTRGSILIEATEAGIVHRDTFYKPGQRKASDGNSDESDYNSSDGSSGSYSDESGTDGEGSNSSSSDGDHNDAGNQISKGTSNVSALTALSMKLAAKKRPRNTAMMKLPNFVFSSTEGLSRKEIKKRARLEAKRILKMRKDRVAVSEEQRTFSISATPQEINQYLQTVQEGSVLGQGEANSPESRPVTAARTEKKLKKVLFVKEEESGEAKTLLKNGKFGPDDAKFCMDLPEYYPSTAGMAKGALEDHLIRYEKMRKRAEKLRIRSADELRQAEEKRLNKKHLPEWLRNMISYGKSEESMLAKKLEADLSLFLLTESAYIAKRQLAMAELPGMLPHYPVNAGKYLPAQSLLYSNTDPPQQVKGRTATDREMAQRSTVGRGKQGYVPPGRSKADMNKSDMDLTLIAANKAADEELDAANVAMNTSSGVGKNRRRSSLFNTKVADDDNSVGAVTDNKDRDDLLLPFDQNPTGENVLSKDMVDVEGKRPTYQYGSYIAPSNGFTTKRKGFPDGVFLERRLSFAHAPGLESLSHKPIKETHLDILVHDALENGKRDHIDSVTDGGSLARSATIVRPPRSADFQISSRKYDAKGNDITKPPTGFIKLLESVEGMEISHHGSIFDAVFSPSEHRLASAGGDSLIKFWDPRDGSLVRSLKGHESEVTSLAYTTNEAYLVSTGADHIILVWDLMVNRVTRTLKGHVDVINSIAISPDCTTLVSSSYDWTVRTWKMTPHAPEKPLPPKLVAKSENMIMICWTAPPCFNEELTAQFLQYRVNSYHKWMPEVPMSIPPHYRSKVFRNMPSTTTFRFRVMAENKMGKSEWSNQSREMKTDMGLPSACEVPLVCGVSPNTLSIFWFSQSIKYYGSAPTKFVVETSGNGKEFGECPSIELAAADCERDGETLLGTFKEMYRSRTIVGASGGKKKNKLHYTGVSIPTPHLLDAINRSLGKDFAIMTCTIENLTPGHLYRTRIRGVNPVGAAEWSMPSLSQSTLAGLPAVPEPPTISSRTLTSITWSWKPPNDGGSALTGYRLWIQHWNYYVDLPRWQTSYVLGRLLPGKQYFVKVLAKNVTGSTEYSDFNEGTNENSFTAIEPPDIPRAPEVVAGTCRSLTIQFQLPYLNGSPITTAYVQRRVIHPFSKGPWEGECTFDIHNPLQVQVIKHIDYLAEEFDVALGNNNAADGSFNPFDRTAKKKTTLSAKTNKYGLVGGTEYVLKKSEGSILQIEITKLTADTVYEFRVACRNGAGRGLFSSQSSRAKANRAELPGVMPPPQWENIAPSMASFILTPPEFEGGIPITHYSVEMLNMDTMLAVTERHIAGETEFEVLNLSPGARYKARVAVENKVGLGPFSNYTKVVILPLSAAQLIAMASTDDAGSVGLSHLG